MVDQKADEAKTLAIQAQQQAMVALTQQAANEARAEARWQEVQTTLRRIEAKLP
jgi:hypothetical protein